MSENVHKFWVMCFKQAEHQNQRRTSRPILIYIGPGKLDVTNNDKILVECRYNPKDTAVSPEGKEGLVKTVYELRREDDTEIFVRKVNEAGVLQNKYYDENLQEFEKPAPKQIVILCHPPRTRTARMYIMSKKIDAKHETEVDKKTKKSTAKQLRADFTKSKGRRSRT